MFYEQRIKASIGVRGFILFLSSYYHTKIVLSFKVIISYSFTLTRLFLLFWLFSLFFFLFNLAFNKFPDQGNDGFWEYTGQMEIWDCEFICAGKWKTHIKRPDWKQKQIHQAAETQFKRIPQLASFQDKNHVQSQ